MFTRFTRTSVAGAVLALASTALVATPTSQAATPTATSAVGALDIRVELNLPDFRTGSPKVFEVTGVTPSAGVELTNLNEISNPDGWGGWLAVDIQPGTRRVVLTPDPAGWDFQTVKVRITSPDIRRLSVVSDKLFGDASPDRSITIGSNYVEVNWSIADSTNLTGLAKFKFPATSTTKVTQLRQVAPGRSVRASVKVTGPKPRPGGKVDMVLTKGSAKVKKVVKLTKKGTATALFKKLKKGKWTFTATYRGDGQHLSSTVTKNIELF
ncbi:MAG: Ig-like domain repeat protein [Nocardioides sp.]|uniref:Ig-like domain repeat protein n=1 Tax=Nocardioides sp. TaxID=35761 RepID=UPI003F062A2E